MKIAQNKKINDQLNEIRTPICWTPIWYHGNGTYWL